MLTWCRLPVPDVEQERVKVDTVLITNVLSSMICASQVSNYFCLINFVTKVPCMSLNKIYGTFSWAWQLNKDRFSCGMTSNTSLDLKYDKHVIKNILTTTLNCRNTWKCDLERLLAVQIQKYQKYQVLKSKNFNFFWLTILYPIVNGTYLGT